MKTLCTAPANTAEEILSLGTQLGRGAQYAHLQAGLNQQGGVKNVEFRRGM